MTTTTMNPSTSIDAAIAWCKLYTGKDPFIVSIRTQLSKGRILSPKQSAVLIKRFEAYINNPPSITPVSKSKKPIGLVPDADADIIATWLAKYNGTFNFLMDMCRHLNTTGLSDKQWMGVIKCYNTEQARAARQSNKVATAIQSQQPVTITKFASPVPVIINRTAAMKIKHTLGLTYGPFALVITGVVKSNSYGLPTEYTAQINGSGAVNVCRICGKSLVDHKSVVSGIGPVCAKNLGQLYHTYQTNIQAFMQAFAAECAKVGEFTVKLKSYHFKQGHQQLTMAINSAVPSTPAPQAVPVVQPAPAPTPQPVQLPTEVHIDYDGTSGTITSSKLPSGELVLRVDTSKFHSLKNDRWKMRNKISITNTATGNSMSFTRNGDSNIYSFDSTNQLTLILI